MHLRKLRLRTLLTSLSVGGVLLTSCLLLGTLLIFQKSNIENSLLDNNIAYARKLADTTDRYFQTAESELAWSASEIKGLNNPALLRNKADRLRLQSGFFNSVVVVNREAVVAATSPETLKLVGVKLTSDASRLALSSHKPHISEPYVSAAGNYVVFISHPLFSSEGKYLGYIGGTIYLKKQSMLSDILSQHFYSDNSTVSIVSNDGNIIFSHNSALVGTKMNISDVLKKQLRNTDYGRFSIDTNHGEKTLTGYASLSKTNWNIFISGTSGTVNQILINTIAKSLLFVLAIITLTAFMVAALAARIASPLAMLADLVRTTENETQPASLQSVEDWYHEAESLKKAVEEYRLSVSGQIAKLSDEVMTDPLTGLCNRRGFDMLTRRNRDEMSQGVIAIDIDHFKKVNDTYGHGAGDAVLVTLAALLRQTCRTHDVISRTGGEEFVVWLPHTTLSAAAETAERIRRAVSDTSFPFAGKVTVSAGVASMNNCDSGLDEMLRNADRALYEAKGAGRNVVVLYSPAGFSLYEPHEDSK